MTAIHPSARDGFTAQADSYARGRPDYPAALVDWLRTDLALHRGSTVLDLGAGTGKFLSTLKATGATVTAVEPVAAMRAQLAALHPDVVAQDGTAERIPLDDGSMDAVVCAQAFHWFANHAALQEIRRVLKPGGVLGLIWNERDETVPWVAALTAIMQPYLGDVPRQQSLQWRNEFPAEGFGPLRDRHFGHGHTGTPERVVVERVLSVSYIASLPPDEQAVVIAKVRNVIATTPALAGMPEVTFPYTTAAYSCTKIG